MCNKVGGIYTVLSTRAKTLQSVLHDNLIFIGPDCWKQHTCPYFREDNSLLKEWQKQAEQDGLRIKIGRWTIPSSPVAVLVDFEPYYAQKDTIYAHLWEDFQVDSLHAYGDYDEASMFSYAAAKVVESFYRHQLDVTKNVIYHGNEWMTGLGLLYIRKNVPEIGTIFTTHATSIGRSIAGNNKPLYQYLFAYHGDQMADELNMQSKHSIEKQTAHHVDCFTTVSDITAKECVELLDKPVDEVLLNGFEDSFVPHNIDFIKKRAIARNRLLQVANALMGETFDDDTLIVSTSGRYEYRNKGIDVFVDAMNRVRLSLDKPSKKILAVIAVPAWVGDIRSDLQERLQKDNTYNMPLPYPMLTHWLRNMNEDRVLNQLQYLRLQNDRIDNVKVMFIPCYLTGNDGILNLSYYDYVLGNDICVYPSYYEPWGYTPLEAIAFSVPCITTDLAGFGLWADKVAGRRCDITTGVEVVHRTDDNFNDVADNIAQTIIRFAKMPKKEVERIRKNAASLSKKALWNKFIVYYWEAYDKALICAENRKYNKKRK